MPMSEFESETFDLAAFLVSSARDALEATPAYGALRLLQALDRLTSLSDDAFVAELSRRASTAAGILMENEDSFRVAVDELLVLVAEEAKRRNLGSQPDEDALA